LVGLSIANAQSPVIVTWTTGTPLEQQSLFIDSFNNAHDDIKLEMVFTEDLRQTLNTSLAAGRGPDIIETDGPAFATEYANANLLLDMTPYAEQFGWKDVLLPWAYDSGLVGDMLASIPQTFETFILYYNVEMFEANGWALPTSLEDINAICNSAALMDVWCFSHGGGGTGNEWYVGTFLTHHAGADNVYRALTGELAWNDAVFVDAITALKTQVDAGWWSGDVQNYFTFGWGDYQTNFCQGRAAMMISGTWDFNFIDSYCNDLGIKLNWDWMPIPALREGVEPTFDLAIGNSLSINARSEHADATAEVLNWLMNDPARALEQSAVFSFGEWFVPLHYEADDMPEGIDPRVTRYISTFAKVTGQGYIGYTTWTFLPIETDSQLIQGLSSVLTADITVETYLTEINDIFVREAGEGKVPPAPPTAAESP
jgi:raffinose/stachyose/melibiose transport system substrate-binding protein